MKRLKTTLFIASGIMFTLLIGCLIFFSGDKTPTDNSNPSDTTKNPIVMLPGSTDDDNGNDTKPSPTPAGDPMVESGTHEDVKDKVPAISTPGGKDKVVSGVKDKDTVETGPASGEDRNDEILKEKEENAPPKEKEENKPVIVEDEKTGTTDGKNDAEITDEKTCVDGGDKNGPVYKPSIGGSNPFDNDTNTEIDDKPVEDYVGTGENRPGAGIHF